MTWITRDYDFYELLIPQILRGIGMMFAMVPTNNIALGTLPPERLKNGSGLFNLTRNLGGAVGLAVINQVLNERTDLHIVAAAGARATGATPPRPKRSTCSPSACRAWATPR